MKDKERKRKTRPSRPIRCNVLILERMRYRRTDRQTNQPTDRASYSGALSQLKKGHKITVSKFNQVPFRFVHEIFFIIFFCLFFFLSFFVLSFFSICCIENGVKFVLRSLSRQNNLSSAIFMNAVWANGKVPTIYLSSTW